MPVDLTRRGAIGQVLVSLPPKSLLRETSAASQIRVPSRHQQ